MKTDLEALHLLIDALEDYAVIQLAPDGTILSWNRGATRLMGYDDREVSGVSFSIFYPEEALRARKPERELEEALRIGRIEDEGWRIRKDGSRFWANTVITALIDESGDHRGFAKVTRDLTERREAEARLRQSEEMMRLLIQSVKDYGIFMLDPEGRVASWNSGAQRIKGYRREEIIGRHFSTFYPPEDLAAGKPEWEIEVALREGSVEDEGWRLRKDGSRFWANVVITAIRDAEGRLRGFAKVTRDVTERKKNEEVQQALLEQREARLREESKRRDVEASFEAALEASRAKDQFLMTLSHELRTPITSILGWSRILTSIERNDPAFGEGLQAIARSAELQSQLIEDVLDVSRIVSGKLHLDVHAVEIETILKEAAQAVRPAAHAKNISLDVSTAPDAGEVAADPIRLQQVIWNLLTNAVKFTPVGGQVSLEAHRSATEVEISVVDTGIGIDDALLPHVFEAFRQGDADPRSRLHSGLGLGLSIVRYLIEAHGGTVSAESEGLGKGARFTVRLPVAIPRVANATSERTS
jgi:hypothetical protein